MDCYSSFEGNERQQVNAEQAYIQPEWTGKTTWVELPPEASPESWYDSDCKLLYERPVVQMKEALYGHPDSGTIWERGYEKMLGAVGLEAVAALPSCFWHEDLKLLVTIYVDDIRMSGPSGAPMRKGRELIKIKLTVGDVSFANFHLGCIHNKSNMGVPGLESVLVMEYSMECYLKQFADDHEELATELTGKPVKLGRVPTHVFEEDCSHAGARAPRKQGDPVIDCP